MVEWKKCDLCGAWELSPKIKTYFEKNGSDLMLYKVCPNCTETAEMQGFE